MEKKSSDGYGRKIVAHDERRREASIYWEEGVVLTLFFSTNLYPLFDICVIMLTKP